MVFVSPSSVHEIILSTSLVKTPNHFHHYHNHNSHPQSPITQTSKAFAQDQEVKDDTIQNENYNPNSGVATPTFGASLDDSALKKRTTPIHKRKSSNIVLEGNQGELFSLSFLKKKSSHSRSSEDIKSPPIDTDTPKLVRKKSGELVKSSLKLNSLCGSGSKSMPATPYSYNKSVHFGQNVDVRYFNQRDKPTAVSANTSPILKPARVGTSTSSFDLHGFKKKHRHNGTFGEDDDDVAYDSLDEDFELSADSESDDYECEDYEINWELKPVNFEKTKYNEQFGKKSKLFLEKILIDEYNKSQLVGYVAVKNLAYEKRIYLRYTLDDWKTIIEIEAFFSPDSMPRILKRTGYDRFKFTIDLNNLRYLIQNKDDIHFKFAIRYNYQHEEIWDNNMDKNYDLLLTRKTYKTFHRTNATLTINDYFDEITHVNPYGSSTFNQNVIGFDEIDDYFNNYKSTLKSPETPYFLKANNQNNDDVSQLNFSTAAYSSFKENTPSSATSTSHTNNYTTDKPGQPQSDFSFSTSPYDSQKKFKLPINSKSYQELLETYCFYRSPDNSPVNSSATNNSFNKPSSFNSGSNNESNSNPSTISTFLTESVNNQD